MSSVFMTLVVVSESFFVTVTILAGKLFTASESECTPFLYADARTTIVGRSLSVFDNVEFAGLSVGSAITAVAAIQAIVNVVKRKSGVDVI